MKFFKLKRLSDVLYFIMMVVIFLIPSIQVLAATSIGGCETNTTKGGVQCSWNEHKSWSAINTTACVQEATCATTVSSTATVWCATPLSMSVCVCQTGYFNCSTSGDCTYRHTTDHCALYDNCTGLCTRCDPGYQLTTDKLCVGAILKLGPGSVSGSSVIQGSDTSSTMFISGDSVTVGGTSTGADIYIVGASTLGNLRMINNKSIKVDSNSANTTLLIGNYGDGQGFGYGASTTYTASLAVEGDVKANQLCIKESCRGTWADIEGINYWTASGDNIYNNNTGNVGIGDTGPTNKLSVNGDIAGSGTLKISNSSGLSYVMGNLSVGGSGGFSGITLSRYLDIIGGDYVGEVLRSTDVSSIILSAKNGTPNGADFGYSGKQMVVGTINNSPINFIASGTSKMFINSNGKVGIGTMAPGAPLEVKAPVNTDAIYVRASNGYQILKFHDLSGVARAWVGNDSGSRFQFKNFTSGGDLYLTTTGAGNVIVDNGNVGIGTTKPVAKLQIDPFWFSNPNKTDTINLAQSGFANISVAPQAMITMDNKDHHPGAAIGLALHNANSAPGAYAPLLVFSKKEILGEGKGFNSAIAAIGAQTLEGTGVNHEWVDGDLMFYTAPSRGAGLVERMRITQGGDVGINTQEPLAKLDVNGSLAVRGTVSFTGPLYINEGNRLLMVDNEGNVSATSTVSVPSGTTGQTLRYGSNAWEVTSTIYVANSGNVGIGTTSPMAALHIYPRTDTEGVRVVSSNYSPLVIRNSSDEADLFRVNQSGDVTAVTSSATRMRSNNYCDATGANCFDPSGGWSTGISTIFLTTATTAGSFSWGGAVGYDAGNKICANEQSGSHFCRTDEIIYLIQKNGTSSFSAINGQDAWIADGPPGYTGSAAADDCVGWTNNTINNLGHFWIFSTAGGGRGALIHCGTVKKIACCK